MLFGGGRRGALHESNRIGDIEGNFYADVALGRKTKRADLCVIGWERHHGVQQRLEISRLVHDSDGEPSSVVRSSNSRRHGHPGGRGVLPRGGPVRALVHQPGIVITAR